MSMLGRMRGPSVHARSAPFRRNAGLRHVSWAEWNSPSDAVRKLKNKQDSKQMASGRYAGYFYFRFLSQMLLVAALLHNLGQSVEKFLMKKPVWIVHWMA